MVAADSGVIILVGALITIVSSLVALSISGGLFGSNELSTVKTSLQSFEGLSSAINDQCGYLEENDQVLTETVDLRIAENDKIIYDGDTITLDRDDDTNKVRDIECEETPEFNIESEGVEEDILSGSWNAEISGSDNKLNIMVAER